MTRHSAVVTISHGEDLDGRSCITVQREGETCATFFPVTPGLQEILEWCLAASHSEDLALAAELAECEYDSAIGGDESKALAAHSEWLKSRGWIA